MRIFEIEFVTGQTVIHFASRRLEIWNKFPPGTIYAIHEVTIH